MQFAQWFRQEPLPPLCFISHAYADADAVRSLVARLLRKTAHFIFPPINVSADERVSDDLISAILKRSGLIYIDGPRSAESMWVNFERDYALRAGLPVYSFNTRANRLKRDTSNPIALRLYPIFSRSHGDKRRVEEIRDFMQAKRHFDVWDSPPMAAEEDFYDYFNKAISERLNNGGYSVFFVSERELASRGTRIELNSAIRRWPNRILTALLDDIDVALLPEEIRNVSPVRLFRQSPGSTSADWNRVDDLIVRIYHLIYQNRELKLS